MQAKTKKKNILSCKKKDLIFYILMMAFPVAQFCIFYIGVNFNSILMAFQKIDIVENATTWTFVNMANAFKLMTTDEGLLSVAKVSVISYLLILCIGTPLGLLFSYYIYKKLPGHNVFRVMLFLPGIISAVVLVTIFQFFAERAVPEIVLKMTGHAMQGLMENPSTRYATVMFYNIWVGFGTSVLLYANGMSEINKEMVESAHLDGAYGIREFWYITLPSVFPTLKTFLITGIAGLFINQLNLFSFYGNNAPDNMQTYGYYLYSRTQNAASRAEYPILSAMGLIMTFVAIPLTMLVKWALDKFEPKAE